MTRIGFVVCLLITAMPLLGANRRIVITSLVDGVCEVKTACTKFDDTEIECACVRSADQWKVEAKVTSRPIVYLSDMRFMLHEFSHIFDFEDALARHERHIEAMTFDRREDCLAFTNRVLGNFRTFMRDIQDESMRLRDPRFRPDHGR